MTINKINLYKNDLPDDLIIHGDISIDTEAMGLNNKRDRLCLIQIANETGEVFIVQFDKGISKAPNLEKLFINPETQKIFHFARFDVAIIYQYLGIKVTNIFCTKIASKLTRTYTDSHGLKDICKEFLNVQISKQQQSSDWGASTITKDQQLYAANDVIYLHALRDKFKTLLIREERAHLAQACFDFILYRSLLDLAGWDNVDIFSHN